MRTGDKNRNTAAEALLAMSQGINLKLPARQPSFDPTHAATPARAGFFTHPKRRKPSSVPQSNITGVSWSRCDKKWRASLGCSKMRISLGHYKTEIEAGEMLLDVLNIVAKIATDNPEAQKYAIRLMARAKAKNILIAPAWVTTKINMLTLQLRTLTASEQGSCKLRF